MTFTATQDRSLSALDGEIRHHGTMPGGVYYFPATCPRCRRHRHLFVASGKPNCPDFCLECFAELASVEAVPKPDLYALIQQCAGELPDGFIITINVERHAGWVELYDDVEGDDVDLSQDGIPATVARALEKAKEIAAERVAL